MNSILVLCFFGATFSIEDERCTPNHVMYEISETIRDLTQFITKLKIDYEMKLFDIYANATETLANATMEPAESDFSKFIAEEKKTGRDIEACHRLITNRAHEMDFRINIVKTLEETRLCINNELKIFKAIENEVENFLNERKTCLLDNNIYKKFFCDSELADTVKTCNLVEYHITSSPTYPLICDLKKYKETQKYLEDKAKLAVQLGEINARHCTQVGEKKMHDTVNARYEKVMRCVSNLPKI